MAWYMNLFGSFYFLSFSIAWLTGVLLKAILISTGEKKKFNIFDGLKNGGFPSTHSIAIFSITTAIGLINGFSDIFFVSLVIALIIASDAVGVRQNVGIQGEIINQLTKIGKHKKIKVVRGHTLLEVVGGIMWGVIVTLAIFLIMF